MITKVEREMTTDKDKVASRYDKWKFFYDLVDNFPIISRPQRRWKMVAVDSLDLCGYENVLDVGTGSGWLIPSIAEKLEGGKVVGTDISQGMVERTRSRIEKQSIQDRAEAVLDDIEDSDFSDDHFDRIIATFTFTTLPNPKKAAKECSRILKPDGRMIILDTGKPCNTLAKPIFYPMMVSAKIFGRTHMDRDVRSMLENSFEVRTIEKNMLGMVYLLDCRI